MTTYLIDTNCLISFVTDRNPDQQKRISPFIYNASVLKNKVTLVQNVLSEFVFVCESVYKIKTEEIRLILMDFINTPGLDIAPYFPAPALLHLWPAYIADFGDAVVAAAAQSSRSVLLTFDGDLRKTCKKLNITAEDF